VEWWCWQLSGTCNGCLQNTIQAQVHQLPQVGYCTHRQHKVRERTVYWWSWSVSWKDIGDNKPCYLAESNHRQCLEKWIFKDAGVIWNVPIHKILVLYGMCSWVLVLTVMSLTNRHENGDMTVMSVTILWMQLSCLLFLKTSEWRSASLRFSFRTFSGPDVVRAQHWRKICGAGCSVILPIASDKCPVYWPPAMGGNCCEVATATFLYHSLHAERTTDDRLETDGDWGRYTSCLVHQSDRQWHVVCRCVNSQTQMCTILASTDWQDSLIE